MRKIKRFTAKALLSFWVLGGVLSGQQAQAKASSKKHKAVASRNDKKMKQRKAVPYVEHQATGVASWYGPGFHGRKTASGDRFDMNELTAAHKTLPLGSLLKVTNLRNNKTVIVKVNDRGPYAKGRILDLSKAAAVQLGFLGQGHARVVIETVSDRYLPIQDSPSSTGDVLLAAVDAEKLLTPDTSPTEQETITPPISNLSPAPALGLDAPHSLTTAIPVAPAPQERSNLKASDALNRSNSDLVDNPAYVLHLAAFASVDYAQGFVQDIRDRLDKEQNKQVFIQKEGAWFVVAFGPFNEASTAHAAQEALFVQLNMQPLLKLAPPEKG